MACDSRHLILDGEVNSCNSLALHSVSVSATKFDICEFFMSA